MDKILENRVKLLINRSKDAKISAIEPVGYQSRFINFMR